MAVIRELDQGNPRSLPLDKCQWVAELTGNPQHIHRMKNLVERNFSTQFHQKMKEGQLAVDKEDYSEALRIFDEIIRSASGKTPYLQQAQEQKIRLYLKQATQLIQSGDVDIQKPALAPLRSVLQIHPNHGRANYLVGIVLLKQGSRQLAHEHFQKALVGQGLIEEERQFILRSLKKTSDSADSEEQLETAAPEGQK